MVEFGKDEKKELNKKGIWVTSDGRVYIVTQMSTSHLLNLYWKIDKRADLLSTSVWAFPEPMGEMALDAYDAACWEEDMMGGLHQRKKCLRDSRFILTLLRS